MPGSPPWWRATKGLAVVWRRNRCNGAPQDERRAVAAKSPPPDTSTVAGLGIATNVLWVVIGAVLVIFMQAGFALVETGFCRAKHAAHVVSTNFAIFGLGFVAFFIVGFALMFGGYSRSALGLDTPSSGGA